MKQTLAAIRSGTDPVAPLPAGSFHRWLEDPIYRPKCDVSYHLVADYDWAVSRHFPEESRRHIAFLRKAIFLGHDHGHRITHLETNGVVVMRHSASEPPEVPTPLEAVKPISRHIQ